MKSELHLNFMGVTSQQMFHEKKINKCRFSGEWTSMEEYTMMIPRDTLDGAFYRAVFNIHNGYYNKAQSVCIVFIYKSFKSCECLMFVKDQKQSGAS